MGMFDDLSASNQSVSSGGMFDDLAAKPAARSAMSLRQQVNQPKYDPTEGMSTLEKVLAGTGKSMVDTGRGLGQMLGLVSRKDVEEARRLDAPLMNTGAGIAGNIGGSIGMALLPAGALKALSMAPAIAPGVASALSAASGAMLAPKTIGGAAALGAGYGLTQPSTSTPETIANMGIGSIAGAAIPAGVRGFQIAKSAAEPFYDKGQRAIVARALQNAAGADSQTALANINAAAKPFVGPPPEGQPIRQMMGEMVPGDIPTVGQIAHNPSIATLERAASQTDPVVMNAYAQRMADQNAARVNALQDIAGNDGRREFFAADRSGVAKQLYDDAFNSQGQLTPYIKGQVTQLLKRPSIDDASRTAQRWAMERGEKPSADGSIRALHDVKKSLDDKIRVAKNAGEGGEVEALQATQDKLLNVMQSLSPEYGVARETYASMSKPINQMDIGQRIYDKSVNKLTGNIQPNAFANALTDGTAAKATGFPGTTLENTMSPAQLNTLGDIKDSLARSVYQQTAGKGGGSDSVQKLAYSNILSQAGVPNWMRNLSGSQLIGNLAGRGADVAYGRANKELATLLGESLLNPQTASEMLNANITQNGARGLLSQRGGGLGLLAPGLLNFTKE